MAVLHEDWEDECCGADERRVAGEKWQCRMEIPKIEDPTGGTKVGPVGITMNKVHESPVKNTWFHIRESVPSPFVAFLLSSSLLCNVRSLQVHQHVTNQATTSHISVCIDLCLPGFQGFGFEGLGMSVSIAFFSTLLYF